MRLEGKVAIVSGAGSGMGASIATLFAKEGAAVVVADIFEDGATATVKAITDAGGRASFVRTDVTSEADWAAAVAAAEESYGKLDLLVNNAGLSSSAFEDPLDLDGWNAIMDVNATGVFLGTRAAIPALRRAGGGAIVNMSSILGFVGFETGHPAYSASKGAVRSFTKATANRYGPEGIRVNSVHPGFMPPMRSGNVPQSLDRRERAIQATPLRRTGETIEVAYGVLFLASDEASFITGTELVIDGGFISN
ncbi:MAG: glucose 1-dehydrogenase [Chloroflexi bacterium]|nr:glucose 1-dehydrogenase [Chloroflexota bacterium]MDA1147206.1 glucose 1-dehydrogenase [Chloroflexota bacterium]